MGRRLLCDAGWAVNSLVQINKHLARTTEANRRRGGVHCQQSQNSILFNTIETRIKFSNQHNKSNTSNNCKTQPMLQRKFDHRKSKLNSKISRCKRGSALQREIVQRMSRWLVEQIRNDGYMKQRRGRSTHELRQRQEQINEQKNGNKGQQLMGFKQRRTDGKVAPVTGDQDTGSGSTDWGQASPIS